MYIHIYIHTFRRIFVGYALTPWMAMTKIIHIFCYKYIYIYIYLNIYIYTYIHTYIHTFRRIFGGYASTPWMARTSGKYADDSAAFLFSLTSGSERANAVKMGQCDASAKDAVFHDSDLGPCFGRALGIQLGVCVCVCVCVCVYVCVFACGCVRVWVCVCVGVWVGVFAFFHNLDLGPCFGRVLVGVQLVCVYMCARAHVCMCVFVLGVFVCVCVCVCVCVFLSLSLFHNSDFGRALCLQAGFCS